MPQRTGQMSDRELAAIISAQITDGTTETATLTNFRSKALAYYEGDETLSGDVPIRKGRSRVVSRDVSDVLGWVMPSLLRVFLGGDRLVEYQPRRPDAEEAAKQATDYVNYLVINECSGYRELHAAIWDAQLFGNGILKHWWDDTPEYRVESLSGLTEIDYLRVVNDPAVEEVIEHSEKPDPESDALPTGLALATGGMPDAAATISPAAGMPPTAAGPVMASAAPAPAPMPLAGASDGSIVPMLHDIKIKRKVSNGHLCLVAIPPEEFRLDRNATMLDEEHVRFAAHVCTRTRSSLIEDGYDRAIVAELPAHNSALLDTPEAAARDQRRGLLNNAPDSSTDLIQVWECYVQIDYDGDGVAEWRRVVTAAGADDHEILANEEWGDDLPFTDLVPDPMPHRWRGNSLYELLQDVQAIKTVLLRGVIDNMYWVNNPMRQAPEGGIAPGSLDKFINPDFGSTIFTRNNAVISELPVPFIADKLSFGLDLADRIREFRTGVSASTMSLDPEALQNQTATAVKALETAGYSKTETYARNIAEYGGMTRLFGCLLRLIVQHQDQPRMIRLRGQWVEMDPSGWDAEMDVIINVGLGSGSRDRDLQMLGAIAAKQELVNQGLGPMVAAQLGLGPDTVFATYRKMVEAAGLKSPETYFPEITKAQVQELMAQMAQMGGQQQQQPDPAMLQAQARVQESQARMQLIAAQTAQVQGQTAALGMKAQGETVTAQIGAQRGMLDLEHVKAQIENLRAAAMANMTKAGAVQSDAEINKQLAALETLDHLVSWHQGQQSLNHEQQRMMQRVQTPGVAA